MTSLTITITDKNVKQGNKQCRGLQPLNPPLGGNHSQVNERWSANRGFEILWFSEMCLGQSAWLRSSPKGAKVVFLCFRSIACRDSITMRDVKTLKSFLIQGSRSPTGWRQHWMRQPIRGGWKLNALRCERFAIDTLNILSTMDVIVRQHFQRKLFLLVKFNHALAKLDGIQNQSQTVLWMLKEVWIMSVEETALKVY